MNEIVTKTSEETAPAIQTPKESQNSLSETIETLGIPQIQRHLFLCADQTKPKCCSKAVSLEAWDYLKRRLKELGLDQATETQATVSTPKVQTVKFVKQGNVRFFQNSCGNFKLFFLCGLVAVWSQGCD